MSGVWFDLTRCQWIIKSSQLLRFSRVPLTCALAVVFASSQVLAQDFETGVEAYNAGDYEAALAEWLPLAEQGDVYAQNSLGVLYLGIMSSDGKDGGQAMKLYSLAAEQGEAGAQFALGWMFLAGMGVPQDFTTAYMWFNLASSNGDADGGRFRDIVAADMTPAAITEAQRRARVCLNSQYKDCD